MANHALPNSLDGVASGQLKHLALKNIFDLPFSEGLIRSMNLLPCSYLLYYFKQKCWLLKWANTTKAAHERE